MSAAPSSLSMQLAPRSRLPRRSIATTATASLRAKTIAQVNHCHPQTLRTGSRRRAEIQWLEAEEGGRQEERFYAVCPTPPKEKAVTDPREDATSIDQAITQTEQNGVRHTKARHFLLRRPARAGELATSVRSHWNMECMHWVLDAMLHDNASRIQARNAKAGSHVHPSLCDNAPQAGHCQAKPQARAKTIGLKHGLHRKACVFSMILMRSPWAR